LVSLSDGCALLADAAVAANLVRSLSLALMTCKFALGNF
jgi:hypothetical protein